MYVGGLSLQNNCVLGASVFEVIHSNCFFVFVIVDCIVEGVV